MGINTSIESKIEHYADVYEKKFRPQIEAFTSGSILARTNSQIKATDIYSLGCQLQQFEDYTKYLTQVKESGTIGDLGVIPQVGLDVITASMGQSILPLIASTQDIDSRQGIIYFKQITATTTGRGRVAGDILSSPLQQGTYSDTYGNYEVNDEVVLQTVAGTLTYEFNLPNSPVIPSTLEFRVQDTSLRVIDDGRGSLLGNGVFGDINYNTGIVNLTFASNPGAHRVLGKYSINVESENSEVQGITGSLSTTDVRAEIFALKSEAGLFHDYELLKRFGRIASDDAAQDLTSELIRTINTAAIKRLDNACTNTVLWSKSAPAGVSYADHKRTFIDAYARAEGALNTAAGRGVISRMIAGTNAAAVIRGLEGFVSLDSDSNQSVGLYGYLNSIPVIRAGTTIDPDTIICCYKGNSYFEAPLVYAPYMPLFVSNTLPSQTNPLRSQRVAAMWAGLKVVIPAFLVRIKITP